MGKVFAFIWECIASGATIGWYLFGIIDTLSAITWGALKWRSKFHPTKLSEWEHTVSKWAGLIFIASFAVSTVFVAPFKIAFDAREGRDAAQNALSNHLAKPTVLKATITNLYQDPRIDKLLAPSNVPIQSITARASFQIFGQTNFVRLEELSRRIKTPIGPVFLAFGRLNRTNQGIIGGDLRLEFAEGWANAHENNSSADIRLWFEQSKLSPLGNLTKNPTVGGFDELDEVWVFSDWILNKDVQIDRGAVEVTINGYIQRRFPITPQKWATNGLMTSGDFSNNRVQVIVRTSWF